jgi:hypothetical protein
MMTIPPVIASATEPFLKSSTIASVTNVLPRTFQSVADQFGHSGCTTQLTKQINVLQQGLADVGSAFSQKLEPIIAPVKTHISEAFNKTKLVTIEALNDANQWLVQQYEQALPLVGKLSQQYGEQLQSIVSYGQEWLTNTWEDLGKAVPKSLWPNTPPSP